MKTDEKSEAIIVPEKIGNVIGGKDRRIMNFQRRELHERTQNRRKCINETSADSGISAKRSEHTIYVVSASVDAGIPEEEL